MNNCFLCAGFDPCEMQMKLFRSVMGISDVMQEMSKEMMKSGSSMATSLIDSMKV